MSTVIKTGWLKDKNGEKFAPKTLTSQVITSDGVALESAIEEKLDELKNEINSQEHDHNDEYDAKGSADAALDLAKTYTDSAISQRTQVQIITWGDDD